MRCQGEDSGVCGHFSESADQRRNFICHGSIWFLSYYNGKVYIPNKELMDKFDEMVQKEASLGYVYRLAKESERMLEATLHGDTETMENILAYVHNTETPILSYNNETELSVVVNLVYLAARDRYRVEREDKSGKGFVDFIFIQKTDRTHVLF